MDNLEIAATDITPSISFNANGELSLKGKAMMEDASSFFAQIHSWISKYIGSGGEAPVIEIDLKYFNSSAAKQLLKMLMTLDEAEINASVKWFFPKGNDVLQERGEELAIMLDIPFDYIEV